MDLATIGLWTLAGVLVAGGLAGLVLPVLPGAPLLVAGLVLAGWIEDFTYLGAGSLVAIAVLGVLAMAVDFVASAFGARRYGASRRAVLGATIGAIAGLFFGLVGVLLGPFVGAVIGELSAGREIGAAGRAGLGAAIGLALGSAAKLALGFAMLGIAIFMRFVWPA